MPRSPITDLTVYADKPATESQERFAEWILEVTGKEFGTQKEVAAFREGVRLAKALVMRFQAANSGRSTVAAPASESAEKPAKAKKSAKSDGNGKTRRKRAAAAAASEDEVADAPF